MRPAGRYKNPLTSRSEVIPQSECGFGLTYDPSTFRQILDENFNTVYGDGEMLAGAVGYENVTLANTTVPNQIIASVNLAAYNGDNISSGLIGLAYPNLTQAYPGNDPWADDPGIENDIPYSPLFTTMWQTLGVPPLFSLALARGNDTSNGGVLSLGGLPQGLNYSSNFISTPIKLMQVEEGPDLSNASFTSAFFAFYAVDVDSISIPAPYSNPSYSNTSGHRDHRLGQIPHPRARKPTTSRNYFTKRDLNRNGRPQYDLMDRLFPRQAIAGPESSPKGGPEEGPGPGVGVEPSVGDPGVSPSSGPEAPPGGSVIPADGEGQSIVMIVDSGTTINYFPNNIAEAINSAFSPPAEFDPQTGEYYVDCDAVAPRIGITINGTEFFVNPHDMILHNIELGDDAPPDMETPCGSGAGSAGADGTYVLGDVFLKNVLAVFDVGAGEMRFTARENY